MKTREVVIYNGEIFTVVQGIQRIDHLATHGWQLRYGGTRLFSDRSTESGAAADSLKEATRELLARVNKLPAPSRLQREPNENKTSDLPVGISGPMVRLRPGARCRECSFAVTLPRFRMPPVRRSVYIANENTWSVEKYNAALEKAIQLRGRAEQTYRAATTQAKRAEARAWTAQTRQAA